MLSIEWVSLGGALGERDRRAFETLLTPEEAARARRYHFDRDRNQFFVGRALARTMVARVARVAPKAVAFDTNAYGCPFLHRSVGAPGLHFNISHTATMVICGVAEAVPFGVDVERLRPLDDLDDLARISFSPSEVRDVRATPVEGRTRRFFDYWTLKEAYIKARRMGVSLPLDKFGFTLGGARIGIAFEPPLDDDPDAWQAEQRTPAPQHLIGVAVRRGVGPDLPIDLREVTIPELAARARGAKARGD